MELMYQGKKLEDYNFIVDMSDADIKAYNRNNISKKLTNDNYRPVNIEERRNEWFYPAGYDDLDLRVFFERLLTTRISQRLKRSELWASFTILKKKDWKSSCGFAYIWLWS